MNVILRTTKLGLAGVVFCLATGAALAQSVEEFYKGKQIDLLVSVANGGNGVYARPMAKYMRRYIPGNPNIVIREMPGAGGLTVANYAAQTANKEGLAFTTVNRGILIDPLLKTPGANFDASKLRSIGSLGSEVAVCALNAQSAVDTIQKARESAAVLGSIGPTTITTTYPHLLNAVAGTKFKVVTGYPTTGEIMLAMERREVDGICVSYGTLNTARPDWIPGKKVNVLVQFSFNPHPDPNLKGVATLRDLVRDADSEKMAEFYTMPDELARPYFAPQEVPADRLVALRKAFELSLKDPEFLAEAGQLKLEVDYMSGEDMERRLKALYAIPASTVQKVVDALARERETNASKK